MAFPYLKNTLYVEMVAILKANNSMGDVVAAGGINPACPVAGLFT